MAIDITTSGKLSLTSTSYGSIVQKIMVSIIFMILTLYGHAKVSTFDDTTELSSNFLGIFKSYFPFIELCVSSLTLRIDTDTQLMSIYRCVM